MLSHGRVAALTTATLVALVAASCESDRPVKSLVSPPPAPSDSVGVAGFLRHTVRLYKDGSVFHESTEVHAVRAVFERGVARVDSGPILAMVKGAAVSAGSESYTDDQGHAYTVASTTDGSGLPNAATVQQDGQLLSNASFSWLSSGDAYILASQTVFVYYSGQEIAEDQTSFSATLQEVRLAPSIRAQQIRDARQHPVRIASAVASPCIAEWVALAGASGNLLLAGAVFSRFPSLAAGWLERAVAGYIISLVALIRCEWMMT